MSGAIKRSLVIENQVGFLVVNLLRVLWLLAVSYLISWGTFPVFLQPLSFTKLICKLNRLYCRGLYLTMSLNIASNGSMLGSIDLLKCLHFVNIWRHFLWLNKDQPMWTDSLYWKNEQISVLKMLACSSLPVSSTSELKHLIGTIAQTHFTRCTK